MYKGFDYIEGKEGLYLSNCVQLFQGVDPGGFVGSKGTMNPPPSLWESLSVT